MTITISTSVTSTVVLDAGNGYGVIITTDGTIRIDGKGADGIKGTTGTVTNDGHIYAGTGTAGINSGSGGVGVFLPSGTVYNAGAIYGGTGGTGVGTYIYNNGGTGVDAKDVVNTGYIYGGNGGRALRSRQTPGSGAAGVYSAHGTVTNSGTIKGGTGGEGVNPSNGGAGVVLGYSSMVNKGIVIGGDTSPYGFPQHARYDGYGGVGVSLKGGTLTNAGSIHGGESYGATHPSAYSQVNGAGVYVFVGTLYNSGTIIGGAISAQTKSNAYGSAGVDAEGSTVVNTGTIIGGAGVYVGAAGLVLDGGTVLNEGLITLGTGSITKSGYGVVIESGTFTNAGTVVGGEFSVDLGGSGSTLVIDPGAVFDGNVAVIDGATDTIVFGSGSQAGTFNTGTSNINLSNFGTFAETSHATWSLVGSGYFNGQTTISGLLGIAGSFSLGHSVAGTGTISVHAGATLSGTGSWTVAAIDSGLIEATSKTLTLDHISGSGSLIAGSGDTIDLTSGGTLTEKISGAGTLELGSGSWHVNKATLAPGLLKTGTKALLTDAGSIATTVTNDGTITAYGGTLSLTKAVSGTGTFLIKETQALSFGSSVAGGTVVFDTSGATLDLADPSGFAATLADFATQDSIDLLKHVVTKDSFSAGTLTLTDGSTVVAALHFSGTYTAADFSIKSDGHGGTSIGFA